MVDVGRVMGVLEPVTPVTLPHSGPQNPLQLPDYRWVGGPLSALRRFACTPGSLWGPAGMPGQCWTSGMRSGVVMCCMAGGWTPIIL